MQRIIALLTIAAVLTSVGAVRVQEPAVRSKDYWLAYAGKLPIGSKVHVRTTDGRRMTAILAIVDDTGITLETNTRIPEPPRHIPFDRLEQIELKPTSGPSVGKAVAIGVGAGAATFFGIFLAILAAYAD